MDQNPSTFNFTEAKKMITSPLALDTFLKSSGIFNKKKTPPNFQPT